MKLVLPYPPSLNTYWRHIAKGPLAGRTLISEKGRAYRNAVRICLFYEFGLGYGCISGRVHVEIEARMPDRRRRDLDNIPKAVLDALTHAEFWDDDSQIDDLHIWRSEKRTGEIVVTVRSVEEAIAALTPEPPNSRASLSVGGTAECPNESIHPAVAAALPA